MQSRQLRKRKKPCSIGNENDAWLTSASFRSQGHSTGGPTTLLRNAVAQREWSSNDGTQDSSGQLLRSLEQAEKKSGPPARQKETSEGGLQFIPMVFRPKAPISILKSSNLKYIARYTIVSAKERDGKKGILVAVPNSEVSSFADQFQGTIGTSKTARNQPPLKRGSLREHF